MGWAVTEVSSEAISLQAIHWWWHRDLDGRWKSLLEFANHVNSIHLRIKVTLRWSKDKIEFLDTWVKLKDGKIETDLFCKETDKHLYLQRDSDHPKHTKTCIPYGLGLRLKRICSEDKSYEEQKDVLRSQLIRRGYKEGLINREFKKVDKVERKDALKRKNRKKQNDTVVLVLTYSRHLPDIHNIVRSKMHLLYKSEKMKKIFKKPPLVAYRRGANLADVLIHGKLNKMMNKENSNKTVPCGEAGCSVCPHVNASRSFYSTNGDEYEILKGGDCNTRNVVYLLSCKIVKSQCMLVKRKERWSNGLGNICRTSEGIRITLLLQMEMSMRYWRVVTATLGMLSTCCPARCVKCQCMLVKRKERWSNGLGNICRPSEGIRINLLLQMEMSMRYWRVVTATLGMLSTCCPARCVKSQCMLVKRKERWSNGLGNICRTSEGIRINLLLQMEMSMRYWRVVTVTLGMLSTCCPARCVKSQCMFVKRKERWSNGLGNICRTSEGIRINLLLQMEMSMRYWRVVTATLGMLSTCYPARCVKSQCMLVKRKERWSNGLGNIYRTSEGIRINLLLYI